MIGDAWQLIPLAIALALSSVPITVTITVLLTARRVSVPFAAGWVVGLAVFAALFLYLWPREGGRPTGAPPNGEE